MSRNSGMDGKIGCPFYQGVNNERNELKCEGMTKGGVMRQQFRRRETMYAFMESKCEGMCFKSCPLYRAVLKERYHEDP